MTWSSSSTVSNRARLRSIGASVLRIGEERDVTKHGIGGGTGKVGDRGGNAICFLGPGAEAAKERGHELRRRGIKIGFTAFVFDRQRSQRPLRHGAQLRFAVRGERERIRGIAGEGRAEFKTTEIDASLGQRLGLGIFNEIGYQQVPMAPHGDHRQGNQRDEAQPPDHENERKAPLA